VDGVGVIRWRRGRCGRGRVSKAVPPVERKLLRDCTYGYNGVFGTFGRSRRIHVAHLFRWAEEHGARRVAGLVQRSIGYHGTAQAGQCCVRNFWHSAAQIVDAPWPPKIVPLLVFLCPSAFPDSQDGPLRCRVTSTNPFLYPTVPDH